MAADDTDFWHVTHPVYFTWGFKIIELHWICHSLEALREKGHIHNLHFWWQCPWATALMIRVDACLSPARNSHVLVFHMTFCCRITLVNGFASRFRMRQVNIVGASPFSQSSRVIQTLQAPPDVAPTSLTVRTASETSLRLRWVVSWGAGGGFWGQRA